MLKRQNCQNDKLYKKKLSSSFSEILKYFHSYFFISLLKHKYLIKLWFFYGPYSCESYREKKIIWLNLLSQEMSQCASSRGTFGLTWNVHTLLQTISFSIEINDNRTILFNPMSL